MPFNGTGTFVREFNWSNDAANNIPISASRFDGEDNDFASGLSLCLTRDGQGVPTQPLTWSQALTINVASDIAAVTGGRTGGVNNPTLQLKLADGVGGQLNLTTAQTLGLAIQNTNVVSMTATAVSILQALTVTGSITINGTNDLTIPNGTALLPSLNFAASATTGLYSVGANEIGMTIAAAQAFDWQAGQFAAIAGSGVAASLVAAGNGSTLANAFVMQQSTTGLGRFLLGGSEIANISANRNWTFDAPASGIGMTINGLAGSSPLKVIAGSTSGSATGMQVLAGTTTADYCAAFQNQAGSTIYFYVQGDGQAFTLVPPAASSPPSGCFQIGYLDAPVHQLSASTSVPVTDRGKLIELTGGAAQTLTFPALASGALIMVMNLSGNSWTMASGSTLTWLPSGTTGNRTLANNGIASFYQLGGTANWYVWGSGLS